MRNNRSCRHGHRSGRQGRRQRERRSCLCEAEGRRHRFDGIQHRLPYRKRRHGPDAGGYLGAFKGSVIAMLVTLVLSFPVGVLAALYLEEYAPRNRWTDLIEVSINNLAAVPSIIFGLLGLAIFLNL